MLFSVRGFDFSLVSSDVRGTSQEKKEIGVVMVDAVYIRASMQGWGPARHGLFAASCSAIGDILLLNIARMERWKGNPPDFRPGRSGGFWGSDSRFREDIQCTLVSDQ